MCIYIAHCHKVSNALIYANAYMCSLLTYDLGLRSVMDGATLTIAITAQ